MLSRERGESLLCMDPAEEYGERGAGVSCVGIGCVSASLWVEWDGGAARREGAGEREVRRRLRAEIGGARGWPDGEADDSVRCRARVCACEDTYSSRGVSECV